MTPAQTIALAEALTPLIERVIRAELPALVRAELDRRERQPAVLSAKAAAKRAACEPAAVLAALRSGSLAGTFTPGGRGGFGQWTICINDVDAWARHRKAA